MRLAGGGDDAGHRRMAEDVLQEKLTPGLAVELRRPWRQFLAARPREQARLRERAVDDHRRAGFLCQRQDAVLGLALHHRVVELHEIEFPGLHEALEIAV